MSSQTIKHHLTLDPTHHQPPTRDETAESSQADLPPPTPKLSHQHPTKSHGKENASLYFIGTATTLLQWQGIRILTDPNFLHAGEHVHLGPGVTGTRVTNPAVDLHALPHIDAVLLSHYHADHFDELVEKSLRRDLPIVTTPHAKEHLADKKSGEEKFTQVHDLNTFENALLDIKTEGVASPDRIPAIKVTAMPGKHVPPGPLNVANDILGAVPPTNGWMLELGSKPAMSTVASDFRSGYRVDISGDTLLVDDLKEIPKRYAGLEIGLMLIHLGGTTIPGPKVPLLMVTMDAVQGVKLMQLIKPDVTIPVHYDDYDVFLSPLEDFKKAVTKAGFDDRVVYLDRAEEYRFHVREGEDVEGMLRGGR
ncbi:UPF0173 metal-dependent hydrolase [Fulvia fulva]|nr:UPF0173 metal-dependent hydrolase [Fulvia fulva]KAK4617091.1 UPF0173 metal-dependent hydrolase [Fulvia fulva]WPV18952.1 UPF0173 metal-dependent hydrolase [Fulvia fulva]WPV34509.1 UPF0173 metal-dependent hydrolase [Fulvia fulva]